MIQVAHLMMTFAAGGMEELLLQLCRHRDRSRFRFIIGAPQECAMADEFRQVGVPVITGPNAFAMAAAGADLVNLHWWTYSTGLLHRVPKLGRPYVTTLHGRFPIPRNRAVTNICTGRNVLEVQPFPEQCVTLPNGVDVAAFAPVPRPRRKEVRLIRICRMDKCAPYFWWSIAKVLAKHPRVTLTIAGDSAGPPVPESRVTFLGWRRDIPQLLSESDIFVYAPFPDVGSNDLVPMEAAATGLPVVAADTAAMRENIIPGETGFLTSFGDVESMAARIGQLVEDPELRKRMGDAGRRHMVANFDIRRVAQRYEEIYARAVEPAVTGTGAESRRKPREEGERE
jgi:glycosyltransferase involved in cell wall biosynthesis